MNACNPATTIICQTVRFTGPHLKAVLLCIYNACSVLPADTPQDIRDSYEHLKDILDTALAEHHELEKLIEALTFESTPHE